MCTVDEYALGHKCFPSLADLPIQEALTISRAVGMLYRFQGIPKEELSGITDEVRSLLQAHIRKYHKKNGSLSVNEAAPSVDKHRYTIDDICSYAAQLLEAGDTDYLAVKRSGDGALYVMKEPYLHFEKDWLSNVKLMISEDAEVMRILPFLLTCYSLNASYKRNRLDPFIYRSPSEHRESKEAPPPGWGEVFPEYRPMYNDTDPSDNGNWRRNIANLTQYFTEFPSSCTPDISDLLNIKRMLQRHNWLKVKGAKRQRDLSLKAIINWELYRWFAAFCDACNEYQQQFQDTHFNLTLSMALFAKAWKFDKGSSPGHGDEIEDDEFFRPVTWEAIKNDTLRSDIVEITRFQDPDGIDIHCIVQVGKDWLLRNVYDAEPLVYPEPVSEGI